MAIFVTSDTHGQYNVFSRMTKDLKFGDHLYVIGDIVDRGKGSLKILFECIKNPKITLIMGNHEWMMLEVLNERVDYQYDFNYTSEKFERWHRNGCQTTIDEYNELSRSDKRKVHLYLKTLPIAIAQLETTSNKYYLVHGYPHNQELTGSLYLSDIDESLVRYYVWERIEKNASIILPNNQILVFGHTMTPVYQDNKPYEIWINDRIIGIDCGLAKNDKHARLALLNLNNLEVKYY